jgi:hypothetical protein
MKWKDADKFLVGFITATLIWIIINFCENRQRELAHQESLSVWKESYHACVEMNPDKVFLPYEEVRILQ